MLRIMGVSLRNTDAKYSGRGIWTPKQARNAIIPVFSRSDEQKFSPLKLQYRLRRHGDCNPMTNFQRPSGRTADQLRPVTIERRYTRHAEGSVLIAFGDTRVLCTASVEEKVPPFLRGKGEGWVTAEYGMLPRATKERTQREAARGGQGGRTMEIQRLIGRSLRACVDRAALGERTITLDCDVLQADGGTRTAAITGAYVALVDAIGALTKRGALKKAPILGAVAAISVGVYRGTPVLDLDYPEDSACDTDLNVVMNDGGGFIELQGTAEGHAFRRDELDALLGLANKGIGELLQFQQEALARA